MSNIPIDLGWSSIMFLWCKRFHKWVHIIFKSWYSSCLCICFIKVNSNLSCLPTFLLRWSCICFSTLITKKMVSLPKNGSLSKAFNYRLIPLSNQHFILPSSFPPFLVVSSLKICIWLTLSNHLYSGWKILITVLTKVCHILFRFCHFHRTWAHQLKIQSVRVLTVCNIASQPLVFSQQLSATTHTSYSFKYQNHL